MVLYLCHICINVEYQIFKHKHYSFIRVEHSLASYYEFLCKLVDISCFFQMDFVTWRVGTCYLGMISIQNTVMKLTYFRTRSEQCRVPASKCPIGCTNNLIYISDPNNFNLTYLNLNFLYRSNYRIRFIKLFTTV